MGTWIQPDDVSAGLDPDAESPPTAFLTSLITRAEARLAARVGRLAERVAAGTVDLELVRTVLLDAIIPVANNPTGRTSEAVDGVTLSYSAAAAAARIVFPEPDLELLRPAPGVAIRSASIAIPTHRRP